MKKVELREPKSLMVPIDFSDSSLAAFSYAADLAAAVGGKLTALHVIDDPALVSTTTDESFREEASVFAAERLRQAVAERRDDLPVDLAVHVGPPVESIVEEAAKRGIDLIVMGTLGRGGFSRLLLGSVADRVIRFAPCPVLAVKTHAPELES